jgi:hypothetical protein
MYKYVSLKAYFLNKVLVPPRQTISNLWDTSKHDLLLCNRECHLHATEFKRGCCFIYEVYSVYLELCSLVSV